MWAERRVGAAASAATAACLFGLVVWVGGADPLRSLLDREDGSFFVAIAKDPFASHPLAVFPTVAEAAYRYARPGMGLLGWVVSLGHARFVPGALAALTVLSLGMLAAASGSLAEELGADRTFAAIAAVLLPASLLLVLAPGMGDGFATAFALSGLVAWLRDNRAGAIRWWCLAALFRETTLVFPLAAFLGAPRERRLVIPVLTYGAWVAIVRVRIGAWPTAASGTRLSLPWNGIPAGLKGWSRAFPVGYMTLPAGFHIMIVGVTALVMVGGMAACRGVVRRVVVISALSSLIMGSAIWFSAVFFARILLPGTVVALVGVLSWARAKRGQVASSAPPEGRHEDSAYEGAVVTPSVTGRAVPDH